MRGQSLNSTLHKKPVCTLCTHNLYKILRCKNTKINCMIYIVQERLMKREYKIVRASLWIFTALLFTACGDNTSSSGMMQGGENNAGESAIEAEGASGSNIPYLRTNHANYSEHGSTQTPAPTKDPVGKSIHWTIAATTEEGASKLAEHIEFMDTQLQADRNPRGWDKLFLMEAYMKFNKYYTTTVERSGTNVVVSKVANTVCAYEVISAHSDAVSGDFFGKGDITNDYSSIAESILASSACDDVRTSLESYISERQRNRGGMM